MDNQKFNNQLKLKDKDLVNALNNSLVKFSMLFSNKIPINTPIIKTYSDLEITGQDALQKPMVNQNINYKPVKIKLNSNVPLVEKPVVTPTLDTLSNLSKESILNEPETFAYGEYGRDYDLGEEIIGENINLGKKSNYGFDNNFFSNNNVGYDPINQVGASDDYGDFSFDLNTFLTETNNY